MCQLKVYIFLDLFSFSSLSWREFLNCHAFLFSSGFSSSVKWILNLQVLVLPWPRGLCLAHFIMKVIRKGLDACHCLQIEGFRWKEGERGGEKWEAGSIPAYHRCSVNACCMNSVSAGSWLAALTPLKEANAEGHSILNRQGGQETQLSSKLSENYWETQFTVPRATLHLWLCSLQSYSDAGFTDKSMGPEPKFLPHHLPFPGGACPSVLSVNESCPYCLSMNDAPSP